MKKRISLMVDELMNYLFYLGAKNIDIAVRNKPDRFEIYMEGDYNPEKDSKISALVMALATEKQEEMEEYYWGLAGDCDVDNELHLIGLMTDEATVDEIDGKLYIKLVRMK